METMEVRNLFKKEPNHEPYASVFLPAKQLLITEFQSLLLFIRIYMHGFLLPTLYCPPPSQPRPLSSPSCVRSGLAKMQVQQSALDDDDTDDDGDDEDDDDDGGFCLVNASHRELCD